eukprot:356566-Chlamydomonas_euryale.AAC.2
MRRRGVDRSDAANMAHEFAAQRQLVLAAAAVSGGGGVRGFNSDSPNGSERRRGNAAGGGGGSGSSSESLSEQSLQPPALGLRGGGRLMWTPDADRAVFRALVLHRVRYGPQPLPSAAAAAASSGQRKRDWRRGVTAAAAAAGVPAPASKVAVRLQMLSQRHPREFGALVQVRVAGFRSEGLGRRV